MSPAWARVSGMRVRLIAWVMGLAAAGPAAGQVVPATPQRPITRGTGGNLNGGVTIDPKQEGPKTVRLVTHVVLSASRIWRNGDGRTLEGKLIAFEDVVHEAPVGAAEPPAPEPPKNPTVVRNGKVRLLVGKKAYELPLSRLVKVDQDFIEQVRAGFAKKAAANP